MLPPDSPAPVSWRLADKDEIPRGATSIANAARKTGWTVLVGYSCQPWMNNDGETKMFNPNKLTEAEEDEESEISEQVATDLEVAYAEAIYVAGRRDGHGFYAKWYRKLWTKPGREEGKYIFSGARMIPGIVGAVASPKAKKDLHPENIGPDTVGGLKNSDTLKNYLKQEAPNADELEV